MIRSNVFARRIAAAAATKRARAAPLCSIAVDAPPSARCTAPVASAPRPQAASIAVPHGAAARARVLAPSSLASLATNPARPFSSDSPSDDAATELGSILTREIEEEEAAGEEAGGSGTLPPELADLNAEVRESWTVVEGISGIGGGGETGSGASVRMFKKEGGAKGAKIGIVFHCQDTEEDTKFMEGDSEMEGMGQEEGGEEEDEAGQAVRFGVTVSKGGKTVVIQCRASFVNEDWLDVEGVVVRDGDAESVLAALAGGEGLHASLYQGPEFTELEEGLQESFKRYVVEECGVDEQLAAFISMYCDHREQEEYVSWMKTAVEILD
ncbi:hypothetical protein ACHAWF_002447 [Thalassiosira exigua]